MANRFECESCGYVFKKGTEFCPYCGNPNVNFKKVEEKKEAPTPITSEKKTYFSDEKVVYVKSKDITAGQIIAMILLTICCAPIGIIYIIVALSKSR